MPESRLAAGAAHEGHMGKVAAWRSEADPARSAPRHEPPGKGMPVTTETKYPLCAKPTCAKPMRPRGYTIEMAPGTVATGHKGQCKSCVQPRREPKPRTVRRPSVRPEESVRVAHVVRGLEAFYARRYARGVSPEAMPSILYTPPAAPVHRLQLVPDIAATAVEQERQAA